MEALTLKNSVLLALKLPVTAYLAEVLTFLKQTSQGKVVLHKVHISISSVSAL